AILAAPPSAELKGGALQTTLLETPLVVEIEATGKKVEGQVVCQINLPGGCEVMPDDTSVHSSHRNRLKDLGGSKNHELRGGALVLYFESANDVRSFNVPLVGRTPGNYVAPPAAIY